MFSLEFITLIKEIFNRTIKDLDYPELRKKLYFSLFLTFILTILSCYLLYLFFDQYFFESFKFSSQNKFVNIILSSFIIQFIISITQFFALWIVFSFILIPIGNLVSSLFEEKIFDIVKEKNYYDFKKKERLIHLSNQFFLQLNYP